MQESFRDEEDSLLSHINAIIKLLNTFGVKRNISSQCVIRHLDYLYDRLDDFLEREEDNIWDGEVGKAIATNTKGKTPSGSADVNFECGLCKSSITMYNFDYDLSMDLHMQEGVHLQALKLQKIKEAKSPVSLVKKEDNKSIDGKSNYIALSEKVATVSLNQQQPEYEQWKYISYIDDRRYYCMLCEVYMTSKMNARDHLRGNAHQKNEQTMLPTNGSEKDIVIDVNGIYWCKICHVSLGNSSNAIQHQKGRSHNKEKLEREITPAPSKEDKFWLKIPAVERDQRIYFMDVRDAVMMCIICRADVPKTYINVLGHIRGKSHSRALGMNVSS